MMTNKTDTLAKIIISFEKDNGTVRKFIVLHNYENIDMNLPEAPMFQDIWQHMTDYFTRNHPSEKQIRLSSDDEPVEYLKTKLKDHEMNENIRKQFNAATNIIFKFIYLSDLKDA